jgi:hypothetical protein
MVPARERTMIVVGFSVNPPPLSLTCPAVTSWTVPSIRARPLAGVAVGVVVEATGCGAGAAGAQADKRNRARTISVRII